MKYIETYSLILIFGKYSLRGRRINSTFLTIGSLINMKDRIYVDVELRNFHQGFLQMWTWVKRK